MTPIFGPLRRGVAAFVDDSGVSFGLKQQVNNSLVAVVRGLVERSGTVVADCVGQWFSLQKLICNLLFTLKRGQIERCPTDNFFVFNVCLRK